MKRGKTRKAGRISWLTWTVALLPVLYVLSCGPSYRLFVHDAAAQYTWFSVYTPLGWVAHACPPVRRCLNWYVALWNRRADWNYAVW